MAELQFYPLSSPQKRIWYTEALFSGTAFANITQTIYFFGKYQADAFRKAVNQVLTTNEGLRLRFIEDGSEVRQYVASPKPYQIQFYDFLGLEGETRSQKWVEKQAHQPFELFEGELYYFAVYQTGSDGFRLLIKLHHLISDALTNSLVIKQLGEYYEVFKSRDEIETGSSPSYLNYLYEEVEFLKSKRAEKARQFWLEKFSTLPEVAVLKNPGESTRMISAERLVFTLSKSETTIISQFSKENGASIFAIFMAGLYIYLVKICRTEDLCLGTLLHNRLSAMEKSTMGMFISTVPIRLSLKLRQGFLALSQQVSHEIMMAMRHQRFPYEELLKNLREKHGKVERLFEILVSYQTAIFGLEEEWHFNGAEVNPLAIHISDRSAEGILKLELDYQTELFQRDEVSDLVNRVLYLIRQGIAKPAEIVSSFQLLDSFELERIFAEQNSSALIYDQELTLNQLFAREVQKRPTETALIFRKVEISYQALNRKANAVAWKLLEFGVKPDQLVAVLANRSVELIAALWGVLKAGAAYLPLDSDYPEARIKYMLEDSGAKLILVHLPKTSSKIKISTEIPMIELNSCIANGESDENPVVLNQAEQLAYVIYTSGSTGKPKGVMIQHQAVHNFILGMKQRINFIPGKRILALTTVSFDIFVLEVILPLTAGLTVVLVDDETQQDMDQLTELIQVQRVEMLQTTPSRMQMLLADKAHFVCLQDLREIMIGGEVFPLNLLKILQQYTQVKIYNMYGPTETTVWSAIKELKEENKVTIGTPIANTQFYLMDPYGVILPKGSVGELWIGGAGLARGYLNRLELNQEKFITSYGESIFPGRLYRTGDLGRLQADGEFECLGRIDTQVKIRGYRIELGEIENQLLKFTGVSETAVVIKNDLNQQPLICAYLVTTSEVELEVLKNSLAEVLPNYMIPTVLTRIEMMPKTQNGKIDRKLLPAPDFVNIQPEFQEAENELERMLMEFFVQVLGVASVGATDNFFGLGGDSIKCIQLLATLKNHGYKLQASQIFENPSPRKLAELLTSISCTLEVINEEILPVNQAELIGFDEFEVALDILAMREVGNLK